MKLYLDCRMFDFNHLPEPGGWNDQDPQLVEDWRVIRPIDVEGHDQGD